MNLASSNDSDALFLLVKSLSKAEKAHLSKYARMGTKKSLPDYLRLFKFLDKQTTYREEAIKSHFDGDIGFVKNYSKKKHELQNKILESLNLLYSNKDIDTIIQNTLNNCTILARKGLWDLMSKRVEQSKKIALKNEHYLALIAMADWEIKILKEKRAKKKEEKIKTLLDEKEHYLEQYCVEQSLNDLRIKYQLLKNKDIRLRKPENKVNFEKIKSHKLLERDPSSLSRLAQQHYHYLKSNCFNHDGDFELSYRHARKLIDLFPITENSSQKELIAYKNSLCNFLIICNYAQKYDEFPGTLNLIRKSFRKQESDLKQLNTVYFLGLRYFANSAQFEKAGELINEIENYWEGFCETLPPLRIQGYCYNIFIIYWFLNDLNNAAIWLSRLLNESVVPEGKLIVFAARLLQLPFYLDLKEQQIENRIDSTRKVLSKQKHYSQFEKLTISTFKRIVRTITKKELDKEIASFQNELTAIINQYTVSNQPLGLDEMQLWCKSKLENKSILEVLAIQQKTNPPMTQ